MKKVIILLLVIISCGFTANAQKFALIDMEYITNKIPEYQNAKNQLDQASKRYQSTIEAKAKEAKALYDSYQKSAARLTASIKKQKEDAIIAKEKEVAELKQKYFGNDGEMYKLKSQLIDPIQNKIYEAVKSVATQYGYSLILDRASDNSIIFGSPKIDVSNLVLSKMGY